MSARELSSWQRRSAILGIGVLYAGTFFGIGVKTLYLPVWLSWKGLTAAEIGVAASAPLFARVLLTTLLAFGADLAGDRRTSLLIFAWATTILLLALGNASGFPMLLLLSLLSSIASKTILPLIEAAAMSQAHALRRQYGHMRLWGSLGFMTASMVTGLTVQRLGDGSIIWLLSAAAASVALSVHMLPRQIEGVASEVSTQSTRATFLEALRILKSGRFLVFAISAGCVQGSHAMFYTFGVAHWRAQGISPVLSSALWNIGVLAEIILFWGSRKILSRLGVTGLLVVAAGAGVARWTAMAFEPPLAVLFLLQPLHALTYGAAHLAAMYFVATMTPPRLAGTMQAVYASATSGIGLGLATMMCGWLYPILGGSTYLAMAGMTAIGLATSMWLIVMRTSNMESGSQRTAAARCEASSQA